VKASNKSVTNRTWRREFLVAYNEGRFKQAAQCYDQNAGKSEELELALHAAKAHMHTNPPAALRLLIDLRVPHTKERELIERNALLVEAYARTRDFESADEKLHDALQSAKRLGDPALLTLVGYRAVRRYLLAEAPAEARKYLELARTGKSKTSQIYAAYAETLILPYEERVGEQANRIVELLRLLDPNQIDFIEIRAWSTHTLAGLVREMYLPDAVAEIDRQLSGVLWPEDFAPNLFQTLRSLGWAKAMQGDYFNAFRHLKHASDVTDTTAWKVVAACDRSYLARCFGEVRWSRVELDEAEQLASRVNWHATLAEERIGLLQLAELFGELDTARSAMYLARYRELGDVKSPLYFRHDARRVAFEQFSTGVVELALGDRKRGLAELRDARKVFERFGFDFRVARCLTAEYRVTNNQDLIPLIEERLRNYRQSWLARELAQSETPTEVPLPRMQRRVFDEICQGKSTAEISKALGRSEYTISNHIKAIFRTFGVKSRATLMAEAVRKGYIKTG
jgi:DNA-binding CsgD family transcriptional regulator